MAKKKDDRNKKAVWVLVAGAFGIGLYLFLKPEVETGPGQTEVAPMPPTDLPAEFGNLGAVATALSNVQINWTTGTYSPQRTLDSLAILISAIETLQSEGVGEPLAAQELLDNIAKISKDVDDYLKLSDIV